jgi:hypothetical protein
MDYTTTQSKLGEVAASNAYAIGTAIGAMLPYYVIHKDSTALWSLMKGRTSFLASSKSTTENIVIHLHPAFLAIWLRLSVYLWTLDY